MISYTYVDGESHYIRSQEAVKAVFGESAHLRWVQGKARHDTTLFDDRAHVFWTRSFRGGHRGVYFTSMVGDEMALHEVRAKLREFSLEPHVILERRQLAQQRQNILERAQVIEKAKGVDTALAVRMLEDAYSDNYDDCHLFTSDVDYLPAIEAVRRRGKRVFVWGYRSGLADRSPLLYVPDRFYDLEGLLKMAYLCMPPPVT